MAPDLQHFYDETFSMMATKGWAMMMEELDILNLLLSRKEACETAYESLQEASE
jgi:hypothetical protein